MRVEPQGPARKIPILCRSITWCFTSDGWRELRRDQRDLRQDRQDMRRDTRDIRQDKQDLRTDRQD
ncbi:MAG TPA: hypothetical protein VF238_00260, partial [Methylomirabilota bacterium]